MALFLRSTDSNFGAVSPQAVTLTANFRSSPELVDWFNAVFTHSFGKGADANLGKVPYQSAISARPDLAKIFANGVTLDIHEGNDAKRSEAELIARRISVLQDDNSLADIAVLVRSRSHLDIIVNELNSKHIPWQGTDIDSLKDEPVVMDLLSIVRMLWQTDTVLPCLAFLRSPMMGLQLGDLLKISRHFHQQAELGINAVDALVDILPKTHVLELSEQASAALSRALPYLGNTRMKVRRVLPRQLIEQLWIRLGSFEVYNADRVRMASIKLLDLIEKQAEESSLYELDIPKLELQVEALYLENTPRDGAVQLMTIHKSKGLQFDHVFLPSLTSTTRARDKELLRWRPDGDALLMASSLNSSPGSLYAWLDSEDAEREANETRRLLYVASTRACLSLHLSGCLKADKPPAKNSLLATIWASVEHTATRHDAERATPPDANDSSAKAVIYQRLPDSYRWCVPASVSEDLFLGTRAENLERRLASSEAEQRASPEIALGLLVHEILYELSRKFPSDNEQFLQQSAGVWRTRLQQLTQQIHGETIDLNQLLERVQSQIQGILTDPESRWLLSSGHTDCLSEAPFTGLYRESLVNVVIDRTFLDDAGTR